MFCMILIEKQVFLMQKALLCQKLSSDFDKYLLSFEKHIIQFLKANNYLLTHIDNAGDTMLFNVPSSHMGVKCVIMKV